MSNILQISLFGCFVALIFVPHFAIIADYVRFSGLIPYKNQLENHQLAKFDTLLSLTFFLQLFQAMLEFLLKPWPWYVAGPLVGLMVPLLLIIGNKSFGISSSFRHICASCVPANIEFLKYDWRSHVWNLVFVLGIAIGGFVAFQFLNAGADVALADSTRQDLAALGITGVQGMVPPQLFDFQQISLGGWALLLVGGFLVGFGTRYAGGCTSGHAIMGLSTLQWSSLVAVVSFFVGGLLATFVLLPVLLPALLS